MHAAPLLPPESLLDPITACRLCGSTALHPVVDFGLRHMVDFPATPQPTKPPLPLLVYQCAVCTLVQLAHTAPSDWRYSTYFYRSGTNEAMRAELADVVAGVKQRVAIGRKDQVLDIGANDGTLLAAYQAEEATPVRIGVEPATNLQAALEANCELALNEVWPTTRGYVASRSCKAVTSIAMLYGADDLNAFTQQVARVLHPEGVWVVQFQDLHSVLASVAIDWFVHEHLATFSLWSFAQLLHRHNLIVESVEPRAINGGSLRVYVRHKGRAYPDTTVDAYVRKEQRAGLLKPGGGLGSFLARVELVKAALTGMVDEILHSGGTIDLYAASTKASLLLQLVGLDHRHIRQAIERQDAKVGRYVGASGIPIVSEVTGREVPADVWLVGAYQFRDVILEREAAFVEQGGLLLFPLPHPELVRGAR